MLRSLTFLFITWCGPVHPQLPNRTQPVDLRAAARKHGEETSRVARWRTFRFKPKSGHSAGAPSVLSDRGIRKTDFIKTLSASHLSSLNFNYFDIHLLSSPMKAKEILTKLPASFLNSITCGSQSYAEPALCKSALVLTLAIVVTH